MKSSSPIDSKTALGLLITNLTVLPGLGTFLGGARFIGALQVALSLLGFTWTLLGVWPGFALLWDGGSIPEATGKWLETLTVTLKGMALFGITWIWSFLSGILIIRKAKSNPPPL